MKIEFFPDKESTETHYLLITLLNSEYKDIFSSLAEDLVHSVYSVSDENELIDIILNRFIKWENLFEKAKSGCT